jgi:hypothetical protein
MEQLSTTADAALRRLLEAQPTTPAKVAFAWRMAAGPAVDRATETEWRPDGVLRVRSRGDAWRREVRQARAMLLRRLEHLLGPGVIARLEIE